MFITMFTCGLIIPPTLSSVRFVGSEMVVSDVTPMHPEVLVPLTSPLFVLESCVCFVSCLRLGTLSAVVGVCDSMSVTVFIHLAKSVLGSSSVVDGARNRGVHCAAAGAVVMHLSFNVVQPLLHHVPKIPCR